MAQPALLFLAAALSFAAPAPEIRLSAAISVPKPTVQASQIARLMVRFTVTNEGTATVDPEIDSSTLFVNGVVPDGWGVTIMNGLRAPNYRALLPGQLLEFAYQLGRYFAKPGVYKIRWEGSHFKSPEITLRVVPD